MEKPKKHEEIYIVEVQQLNINMCKLFFGLHPSIAQF